MLRYSKSGTCSMHVKFDTKVDHKHTYIVRWNYVCTSAIINTVSVGKFEVMSCIFSIHRIKKREYTKSECNFILQRKSATCFGQ
jgi:hypothetical protein